MGKQIFLNLSNFHEHRSKWGIYRIKYGKGQPCKATLSLPFNFQSIFEGGHNLPKTPTPYCQDMK